MVWASGTGVPHSKAWAYRESFARVVDIEDKGGLLRRSTSFLGLFQHMFSSRRYMCTLQLSFEWRCRRRWSAKTLKPLQGFKMGSNSNRPSIPNPRSREWLSHMLQPCQERSNAWVDGTEWNGFWNEEQPCPQGQASHLQIIGRSCMPEELIPPFTVMICRKPYVPKSQAALALWSCSNW